MIKLHRTKPKSYYESHSTSEIEHLNNENTKHPRVPTWKYLVKSSEVLKQIAFKDTSSEIRKVTKKSCLLLSRNRTSIQLVPLLTLTMHYPERTEILFITYLPGLFIYNVPRISILVYKGSTRRDCPNSI